ncbi:MAG: HD domain-containing protein [Clostridia bacterium]|jgi:HD-GYP domain-containing protein (c-di-GMP phosphodiesterase class II)|nr:HD domain-containing protein [Clostridia bacterium]
MVLYIIIAVLAAGLLAAIVAIRRKEAQIQKISRLYAIGKEISANIKFKPLMKKIMETAKEETDAEASSLYLVDEEKQELWFEVALGEKGEQVKEIRLKIGEGIAGTVAAEGRTINTKDASQDSRHYTAADQKTEFKTRSMLTIPIKLRDRTLGVLQVINKKNGGSFSEEDEVLLEGMTGPIALALENAQLYKEMKDLFLDSIQSLASAIDAKDPYTNGHSRRVTEYSLFIGKEMGLTEERLDTLEYMAILHDVGKIGIQDAILNKQAQLDDEEFKIMKTHAAIGAKILEGMNSLRRLSAGAKYHHEKYDGTGYFERLKGAEIPLEARIISVADAYDAMTTDRPYRKGLDHAVALEEVKRCAGSQFDPEVVAGFNKVMAGKLPKEQVS